MSTSSSSFINACTVILKWSSASSVICQQYFGFADYLVPLDELRAITPDGKLAGKELYAEAEVHDWFYDMTATGWAITAVYSSELELKLLGDSARTFKPNQTFDVYVSNVYS